MCHHSRWHDCLQLGRARPRRTGVAIALVPACPDCRGLGRVYARMLPPAPDFAVKPLTLDLTVCVSTRTSPRATPGERSLGDYRILVILPHHRRGGHRRIRGGVLADRWDGMNEVDGAVLVYAFVPPRRSRRGSGTKAGLRP